MPGRRLPGIFMPQDRAAGPPQDRNAGMNAEAPDERSSRYWFVQGMRGLFSVPAFILMLSFIGFAAFTAEAGIPGYEISNHARPGAESRHNLTYWRYGDYSGIGPGAHGRRLGMRTVRHKKPENFLNAVTRNGNGLVEEERLTTEEAAHEALVMGLRLAEGVDTNALADRFDRRIIDDRAVATLESHGLLWRDRDRIGTTEPGRLVLDSILAEIAA